MATMNFSVPDDVKQAFNDSFAGQNKSAVLTQLMRDAITLIEVQRKRQAAVKRILNRRAKAAPISPALIDASRRDGRP